MSTAQTHKTRSERRRDRRHERAMRERRKALSPIRLFLRLVSIPLLVSAITVSIYIRTSPYPRDLAVAHLAAMAGCSVAEKLNLAPAYRGEPGYHARNDLNGDGVACGDEYGAAMTEPQTRAGGAKFVRP